MSTAEPLAPPSGKAIDEQIALLRRGTTEIISEDDLRKKLARGKPLRVKLGVDPTARSVTLGWAVVLRKLRDFQRLGHTAVLVIGDFTAQIGDPSGKNKTRPQLGRAEVQANVDAVLGQVGLILDRDKTEIVFNADWLGKMSFSDVIRLCSRYTVARILERDDFTKRLSDQRPIGMHEILYPLCQGMDSVEIVADVELGGNDQKFNNLVGRNLMEQYGQEPQVVILSPLLVGTDGKEKMSQSLGNYVGVTDEPNDMFGKTMSIPDELIENWFELATDVPMDEARALLSGGKNPRDAKLRLAAEDAERFFIETFSQRKQPVEAAEAFVPPDAVEDGQINVPALLVGLGLAKSNGAAKDLVKAGAVALDGERVSELRVAERDVRGRVLRVGKHHFLRLS
jgi:tyrosyl-tRNA synthetase